MENDLMKSPKRRADGAFLAPEESQLCGNRRFCDHKSKQGAMAKLHFCMKPTGHVGDHSCVAYLGAK